MAITSFKDKYAFLSNMQECTIIYGDMTFKSTEAFYQAMKTTDNNIRKEFTQLDGYKAKRRGRELTIRNDWDSIKDAVMLYALFQKFRGPYFKELLLATGTEDLVEGNYWHDNYWGSCTCQKCGNKGMNKLGQFLMQVRDKLSAQG